MNGKLVFELRHAARRYFLYVFFIRNHFEDRRRSHRPLQQGGTLIDGCLNGPDLNFLSRV
jgi:hypothetical protein